MNVQYFEKGLHINDQDRILFARKIGKLATYCDRVKDESSVIRVEVERRPTKKDRDQVKMMVSVVLPQKQLRAESRRRSPIDAVDRCIEKLEPQIKRYKDLHSARGRVRVRKTAEREQE